MLICHVHVLLKRELMAQNVQAVGGRIPTSFQEEIQFDLESSIDIWRQEVTQDELMAFWLTISPLIFAIEPYYALGVEKITIVRKADGREVMFVDPLVDLSSLITRGQ